MGTPLLSITFVMLCQYESCCIILAVGFGFGSTGLVLYGLVLVSLICGVNLFFAIVQHCFCLFQRKMKKYGNLNQHKCACE
jgi:hypothetical protein